MLVSRPPFFLTGLLSLLLVQKNRKSGIIGLFSSPQSIVFFSPLIFYLVSPGNQERSFPLRSPLLDNSFFCAGCIVFLIFSFHPCLRNNVFPLTGASLCAYLFFFFTFLFYWPLIQPTIVFFSLLPVSSFPALGLVLQGTVSPYFPPFFSRTWSFFFPLTDLSVRDRSFTRSPGARPFVGIGQHCCLTAE